MTFSVYSTFGGGRYWPAAGESEEHWALGPRYLYGDNYADIPKLIHAPQRNTGAKGTATQRETAQFCTKLAQHFIVLVPDLQGSHWGNQDNLNGMNAAYDYLTAGSGEKIFLTGVSHGGLPTLNWARDYPDKVQAIGLVQPALSLADLKVVEGGVLEIEIDSAYYENGGYTDEDDGPTSSPVIYAGTTLHPDIPIGLWTSSDGADTVCRSGPVNEFLQKRPQTYRKDIGPIIHSLHAVEVSTEEVVHFLRSHRD